MKDGYTHKSGGVVQAVVDRGEPVSDATLCAELLGMISHSPADTFPMAHFGYQSMTIRVLSQGILDKIPVSQAKNLTGAGLGIPAGGA